MTVWQFETWTEDKKTNDWRHPIQMMEESKNVLQAIHAALQRSEWDGGFDYQKGFCDFRSPPLSEIKRASRILNNAVACDLKQDRTNAALERLVDAIRLVRLQKDERLIISQLVRIACAALTWNSTWGLLQTNAWSESQLATLQAAWQNVDFSTDMARALEMERAMTLDSFKFSGKMSAQIEEQEKAGDILGGVYSFLPTHGAILHWVHLPLWRIAWVDQDARRSLDRWQELIETDRVARNKSWKVAKDRANQLDLAGADSPWSPLMRMENEEPKKQNIYDRWRYLLSNQTFGVGGSMLRRVVQTETARRMMVTALALKRHLLRHGQPAATLDVLVPELLSAVPVDGMDGKPLLYRPNPDGTFLLYSVGEDGEDGGGDCSLAKGKTRFTQIWDGKDAVWPSPATPEEATKAALRK